MSGRTRFVPSGRVRRGSTIWLLMLVIAVLAGSCSSLEADDTTTTAADLATSRSSASEEASAAPVVGEETTSSTVAPSTPGSDPTTTTTTAFQPMLQAEVNLEGIVAPIAWTRYEDSDIPFGYFLGDWHTAFSSKYSGGKSRQANDHASADISFQGSQIRLIATMNPARGIVEISVDGGPAVRVDLFSSESKYQQVVWTSDVLTYGTHTLTVEWTGLKHRNATNTFIDVDAVEVKGELTH